MRNLRLCFRGIFVLTSNKLILGSIRHKHNRVHLWISCIAARVKMPAVTEATSRKISPASARAHTRSLRQKSSTDGHGIIWNTLLVTLIVWIAFVYTAIQPPSPKICGSAEGPPVTGPRIKLRDGRHLAYLEYGVPRDRANYKVVYVHGFDSCRHNSIATELSMELFEELGLYMVSFDRPGYGESDPNLKVTDKSIALDIEELADQLKLGSKFFLVGFSLGGEIAWSCLNYIPHRLKAVTLIAPAINYWWSGLPGNLSELAYNQQFPQDQWALRVSHYAPWLVYWWNTQKWFPSASVIAHSPDIFSHHDKELMPKLISRKMHTEQIRQQGEYVSVHRDLIFAFSNWNFSPVDLQDPFPGNKGLVHLWQGDEDILVNAALQRHIANQLPWVTYHELPGRGHMFPYEDGMAETIIKTLIFVGK